MQFKKLHERRYNTDKANILTKERHEARLRHHTHFISSVSARFTNEENPWRLTQNGKVVNVSVVPSMITDWWKNREVISDVVNSVGDVVVIPLEINGKMVKITIEIL